MYKTILVRRESVGTIGQQIKNIETKKVLPRENSPGG
jgi:hypothetical protein